MQVLVHWHHQFVMLIHRTDLDKVLASSSAANPRVSLGSPGIQSIDDDTNTSESDSDSDDPATARAKKREEEFQVYG